MMYRHGDVLLVRIGDSSARPRSRRAVLAEGEVTGHAHVVEDVPARLDGDVLHLPSGGTVTHEEHGPIALVPGDYRVIHQRQFTPVQTWSRVRD